MATTNGRGTSKYGEMRYKIIGKYVLDNLCSKEKALEHFNDITYGGFSWHMQEMKKYDPDMYAKVKDIFRKNKSKKGLGRRDRKENQNSRVKVIVPTIDEELARRQVVKAIHQAAATSTVAVNDAVPDYIRYAIFLTDNDVTLEEASTLLNVSVMTLHNVVDSFLRENYTEWFEKVNARLKTTNEKNDLDVIMEICEANIKAGYAKYAKYIIENNCSLTTCAIHFNVNVKKVETTLSNWRQLKPRYFKKIMNIAEAAC